MPLPGTDDLPNFDPKSKEQNIGFNQFLALAKLQQQNNQFAARQQQQDMSMLLRAMGSPSGNASWIGHTAMPQQPTFAPRQGMFSGILSDPWHQYLAQKEYEVRRDRAIANQMDELYRRDSNDRFDQLLALMQAQKGGTPADTGVSMDATQQQSNTQSEDPFDYALKRFTDSLTTAANPEAAINAFNATIRGDKAFRDLLTKSKYNSADRDKILENPLVNLIGLTTDDINSLYDPNISKINLIHPFAQGLIEQSEEKLPNPGDRVGQTARAILRGVGTQTIDNGLIESVYRPILNKLGMGTGKEIPEPELQLAASFFNYMKGKNIPESDLNRFLEKGDFNSFLTSWITNTKDEDNIEGAIEHIKQLKFNQIGNREIYDNLVAQANNAYIGARMADQLAARGYIKPEQAAILKNRYNMLTKINPLDYQQMYQLIDDKNNTPVDARRLIPKYTQGSAVYPDLNARLRDSTNILNSPEMQNYLSNPNNFKKFLMSSYFYGADATKPEVQAAINNTMNEYYKARTPESKDLSSVVKNINTRLADKFNKDSKYFINKPADNGSLYVDLLAKAEGYRDNIFKDSGGKGVYLLSVTNSGNWYIPNANIGTKFSDLSQADQNTAYDYQVDALRSKWKITTQNLHDPNVWKYVKELGLTKDIDDITSLLASSCYRGDSVHPKTLIRTFEQLKKQGKSNITARDVYEAYTDVLIDNYKDRPNGGATNIRVVKSRRDNILHAYDSHKQNKVK